MSRNYASGSVVFRVQGGSRGYWSDSECWTSATLPGTCVSTKQATCQA